MLLLAQVSVVVSSGGYRRRGAARELATVQSAVVLEVTFSNLANPAAVAKILSASNINVQMASVGLPAVQVMRS